MARSLSTPSPVYYMSIIYFSSSQTVLKLTRTVNGWTVEAVSISWGCMFEDFWQSWEKCRKVNFFFFFHNLFFSFLWSGCFPHTGCCCWGGMDECSESGCTLWVLSPPVNPQCGQHETNLSSETVWWGPGLLQNDLAHGDVFLVGMFQNPKARLYDEQWAVSHVMWCHLDRLEFVWVWRGATCFLHCGHVIRKQPFWILTESLPPTVFFLLLISFFAAATFLETRLWKFSPTLMVNPSIIICSAQELRMPCVL